MAKGKRARHAQRAPWRPRLRVPPTALALAGLAALFVAVGAVAVHVLNVPAHLRQEGADAPSGGPTHRIVVTHVRPSETRAARSEQRESPTPSAATTTGVATRSSTPSPTPTTTTARPTPKPSPSSSGGPLPLPTLTRPAQR